MIYFRCDGGRRGGEVKGEAGEAGMLGITFIQLDHNFCLMFAFFISLKLILYGTSGTSPSAVYLIFTVCYDS